MASGSVWIIGSGKERKGKEKMEGTKNCGMSSIIFYWSFTWRLKNLKMQDV